jgi:hypothetical protein
LVFWPDISSWINLISAYLNPVHKYHKLHISPAYLTNFWPFQVSESRHLKFGHLQKIEELRMDYRIRRLPSAIRCKTLHFIARHSHEILFLMFK